MKENFPSCPVNCTGLETDGRPQWRYLRRPWKSFWFERKTWKRLQQIDEITEGAHCAVLYVVKRSKKVCFKGYILYLRLWPRLKKKKNRHHLISGSSPGSCLRIQQLTTHWKCNKNNLSSLNFQLIFSQKRGGKTSYGSICRESLLNL